jgi:hypothetical protein
MSRSARLDLISKTFENENLATAEIFIYSKLVLKPIDGNIENINVEYDVINNIYMINFSGVVNNTNLARDYGIRDTKEVINYIREEIIYNIEYIKFDELDGKKHLLKKELMLYAEFIKVSCDTCFKIVSTAKHLIETFFVKYDIKNKEYYFVNKEIEYRGKTVEDIIDKYNCLVDKFLPRPVVQHIDENTAIIILKNKEDISLYENMLHNIIN